jgi:LysR family transcriptional activator of nhaA
MNYHHLLYFWTVAKCGSIAAASRRLRLMPQTLSAQIRALEGSLDHALFERVGGRLELTNAGRIALEYADKIFTLGQALDEALRKQDDSPCVRVGFADSLPSGAVRAILSPLLSAPDGPRVACVQAPTVTLGEHLAEYELDVAFSDGPVLDRRPRSGSTMLGDSAVGIYAQPLLAARLRADFPGSLSGAPFLLPFEGAELRRALDEWLSSIDMRPSIRAEAADATVMATLAQDGAGAFAAPVYCERSILADGGLERVALLDAVRLPLYATTTAASGSTVQSAISALVASARQLVASASQDACVA